MVRSGAVRYKVLVMAGYETSGVRKIQGTKSVTLKYEKESFSRKGPNFHEKDNIYHQYREC